MRQWAAAVLLVVSLCGAARADQTDPRLDDLFARLQTVRDPLEARTVESLVWQIWLQTDEDDARLLLRQGMADMARGAYPAAVTAFTATIESAPEFAEGWNKRATVFFLMNDFAASIADIQRTLALEPRHFGALAGLGQIYLALDNKDLALKAFEAALHVHPHLSGVREKVDELRAQLRRKPT